MSTNTVDNIFNQLKGNSRYAGLSEDQLYDIANEISKGGMYSRIGSIYSRNVSILDPFYGENAEWAKFTYEELIRMEEEGVLIPEEVLSWAHSMQDADSTSYETTQVSEDQDAGAIEQEVNDTNNSDVIDLKKGAQALVDKNEANQNTMANQVDEVAAMGKDVENTLNQAEELQEDSLAKIQSIVDEYKELESKLKRNIPLSETEQQRFNELSTLLDQETKQYQKNMSDLDVDFDEIASALSELDKTTKQSDELIEATDSMAEQLSNREADHKFTNVSTAPGSYTGIVGIIMSSALAKTLTQAAQETTITTGQETEDVQADLNELAAMTDLTRSITANAQAPETEQPEVSPAQTRSVENQATEGVENEVQDAEGAVQNTAATNTQTTTPSQSAAQAQAAPVSAAATGNAGITETTNVAEASADSSVESDTLGTNNSEESGNDLKAQTQEQIQKCNVRSAEIDAAVNELDPIKQSVEDIIKESKFQRKVQEIKVNKSLKKYEELCNKLKDGEELTSGEKQEYKKLSTDLDKDNGNYVNGLNEKINTLNGYRSSLNYAMSIANQGADIANATIEIGKQLAISELGDRSYLKKTFFYALLNDERQKDLLYGKKGESLGRDAIDRGDVLNLQVSSANSVLTKQIPLANAAQERSQEIAQTKNEFTAKVSEITKGLPESVAPKSTQYVQKTGNNPSNAENIEVVDNGEELQQDGELQTRAMQREASNPPAQASTEASGTASSSSSESGEEISAENGKDAAASAEKQGEEVKGDTKSTEEDAKEMENVDKEAQQSDKQLQKDSKKIDKDIKKNQKELTQNEKQVQEVQQKIEEEAAAIEALQTEVDSLTASEEMAAGPAMAAAPQTAAPAAPQTAADGTQSQAAPQASHAGFSAMDNVMNGGAAASGTSNDTQTKIDGLNEQIMTKTGTIGIYSSKLTFLQEKSSRIVKTMNINTKNYNKAVQKEQEAKEEDQSTSEKVLEVATKIESVASKVALAGFIVGTTGDVLMKVILPPWIPVIGAVMSPVGHAVEAIGNYGVLAANVTKMATYAAQGNLMGALMSAGMAVMAGASALGATAQAAKGFQQLGKNIAQAQARAAVMKAAQETAKQAVTKTGMEGLKQTGQKMAAEGMVKSMKTASKQAIKQTLKAAGQKALMYTMTTMAQSQNQQPEEKKSELNIVLSDRAKEIIAAGERRRANIRAALEARNEEAALLDDGSTTVIEEDADGTGNAAGRVRTGEGAATSGNNRKSSATRTSSTSASTRTASAAKTTGTTTTSAASSTASSATSSAAKSSESSKEVDANNGKAEASQVDKDADGVEADTATTEKNTDEMEEVDKEAQKSDKQFQKDSKALSKDIKKDEKELQKNEKEVQETQQKIEEEIVAVEALQLEVDTLTAEQESSSATGAAAPLNPVQPQHTGFSIMENIAGGAAASTTAATTGNAASNQTEIDALNEQIGEKTNVIKIYSDGLLKTQKSSDTIIKRMNNTTKVYNKTVAKEQAEKQEDQSRSEKVLEVATKVESISSAVAMAGFIVGTTGDVLMKVILPPWIPAVGAVMSPIGHAAEAIGNYGVAAAGLTKAATYAAQGNLLGALTSAASAVMAGASAVSATGQAVKGFQNMGKNIAASQARAAAYQGAKEAAKSAVTATGEEGMKQLAQKTAGETTAKAMKAGAKSAIKGTLNAAKKQALTYAASFAMQSQMNNQQDSQQQEQEQKSEYEIILSDRFKEIQRKNKKRKEYTATRYGVA